MKSYKNSALPPKVGDVIRTTGSKYNLPYGIQLHRDIDDIVVVDTKQFDKQYGVAVKDRYGSISWYGTQNFKLHKASSMVQTDFELRADKTFFTMHNNRLLKGFCKEEEAIAHATELVEEDITRQIVIARVMNVAKAEKPRVVLA